MNDSQLLTEVMWIFLVANGAFCARVLVVPWLLDLIHRRSRARRDMRFAACRGDAHPPGGHSVTGWWTCSRCGEPIDGDPHEDPSPPDGTDGDVHEECCASCHPELAERWGIELVSTDDLRAHAEATMSGPHAGTLRDDRGDPLIVGHPGPTQDQSARAEAAQSAAPPTSSAGGRSAPPATARGTDLADLLRTVSPTGRRALSAVAEAGDEGIDVDLHVHPATRDALISRGLIELDPDRVGVARVTELGRDLLDWRGR